MVRRRILAGTGSVKEHLYRIAFISIILVFLMLIFSVIRTSIFGAVDPEKHVYFEIVFLLLLAVLSEVAVFYFKQENVIVLMLLGILVSPISIEIIWDFLRTFIIALPSQAPEILKHTEIINVFAQLGAILLLFKVGMHSKIEKIFSAPNMFVAVAGVIFPFGAGYLYASNFGGNFAFSMFVGAALSATSVGVTVAVLRSMGVLGKRFSDMIIGAAVIDDILALLVLSIVVNISTAEGMAVQAAVFTFLKAMIFIVGAILSGKYLIEYIDHRDLDQKRFLFVLAFMLFFAYVAEFINLSAIVGSFIAGIILSKSRHYKKLEEGTSSLEYLFMPIFFISLGILVDVRAIADFIVPIIILTAIAILTKMLACGGVSRLFGLNWTEAALVGTGMIPRGEVALIIAAIGLSQGVLPSAEYAIISSMALLTSLVVPPLLSFFIRRCKGEGERC